MGVVAGGAGSGGLTKDLARAQLGDAFDEAKFDEAGESSRSFRFTSPGRRFGIDS